MARAEQPEKYNWWLNELESLGINTLEKNGLRQHQRRYSGNNKGRVEVTVFLQSCTL